VFGRGPLGLTRIFVDVFAGFFLLSALGVGLGLVPFLSPLQVFRFLLFFVIVYTLGLMAVYSWRRNTEVRLFVVGFLFSALVVVLGCLSF
jgi:hypothetical protein